MGLESFKKVYDKWVQNNKKKFNKGPKRLKIFKKAKKGPIYVKRAKPKKEFEKIRKIAKREGRNGQKSQQE